MKPRVFIGSSVEGLSVAYSIQQNLKHDAEITVWDQGVFELSNTTIESLTKILGNSDFGIFVFSPDDKLLFKGEESSSIRDNVLFEFGLFIGHLSRERVFFIKPDNVDLRLPTDLLGITLGTYETGRSDNSLQAATGPFCNDVRTSIRKLSIMRVNEEDAQSEQDNIIEDKKDSWIDLFVKNEFKEALSILKNEKSSETDVIEKNKIDIWITYCEYKLNEKEGLEKINKIAKEYSDNPLLVVQVGRIYLWEGLFDTGIEYLNEYLKKEEDSEVIILLSDFYKKLKTDNEIKDFYLKFFNHVDVGINHAQYLYDNENYKEARDVIHPIYKKYPSNEKIRDLYASILSKLKKSKEAFYLLNTLTNDYPEKYSYWGSLSNAALILDLYSIAYDSILKAKDLSDSKSSWIINNLGNIYNNKGIYSKAAEYLKLGLTLDPDSEYAHTRLSTVISNKDKEYTKRDEIIKEGRILLVNSNINDFEES